MVVEVGCTAREPLVATGVPFKVELTALAVVQDKTELCPFAIDVLLALIPAATRPVVGALTVTVTWPQSVAFAELVAVNR